MRALITAAPSILESRILRRLLPTVVPNPLSKGSIVNRPKVSLAELRTVGELVDKAEAELLSVRSFGKTSLREVKRKLEEMGLGLGKGLPEGYQIKSAPAATVHSSPPPASVYEEPTVDESPVMDSPFVDSPVLESPVEETPEVELPGGKDTPYTETPVLESAIEESPFAEPQLEDSPAIEPPPFVLPPEPPTNNE